MKKSTKNAKKITKNQKTTKKTNLKGATSHKKRTAKRISDKPVKTAQKRACEVGFSKKIDKNDKIEKINYWAPQNVETWEDAKKVWDGRNRTFNQYNKTHKKKLSFSEFAEMQISKAKVCNGKEKTKAKK